MTSLTDFLSQPTVQWILLWLLLALVVVLLFVRRPRTLLLSAGKEGRLEISRHALHRLLEACCEQLQGIASARAQVTRSHGKFRTTLRLKVRPDAKLDAIRGYLTEEIAGIYRDNLGLPDEIGPIHIEVVGVLPQADTFSAR
ncbi:hypothetical protein DB347_01010 [Opitutaceae bacterium EW11]|nr:hypothetical protein DB347_01010 [Opitutaceae bacterium EW11]